MEEELLISTTDTNAFTKFKVYLFQFTLFNGIFNINYRAIPFVGLFSQCFQAWK
jgi:hypothetical protein